ncbi:Periplasmic beta-glucosidase precursor [compost metagenome]
MYPFGYGLSYTSFEYSPVTLSANTLTNSGKITASVTVKNTGNYDGDEVVQLYIQDVVGSIKRPVKELKGFEKISLKAGASQIVNFMITEDMLRFYNNQLELKSEPGLFKVYIGTNSSVKEAAEFELK